MALPKISQVEIGEYGDPAIWRDPCSPLILISDGEISHATRVTDKLALLERANGGQVLFAWAGQYRTDVFLVDDLRRARSGLAKRKP